MQVIYTRLPSKKIPCIATIGVFDGVHRGHQYIIECLRQSAKKKGLATLVITFDALPEQLLHEYPALREKLVHAAITDHYDKEKVFRTLGVDYLWLLKTTPALLRLPASRFIAYLLRNFCIRGFVVGKDFRFGYQGKADIDTLACLGKRYGFSVSAIEKRKLLGAVVSSSRLRLLIREGEFAKIKKLLGRPYSLTGHVVRGKGLGKRIGFPTANLDTADHLIPKHGVYSASVTIGSKFYLGAVNIGSNPTVSKSKREQVEVYILDYAKSLLNKTLTITFLDRLRDEKKFASTKDLTIAIEKDVSYIASRYKLPQ